MYNLNKRILDKGEEMRFLCLVNHSVYYTTNYYYYNISSDRW